jgi:hypothetical protein
MSSPPSTGRTKTRTAASCSVEIYGTPPYCSSLNRSSGARSANRIVFTQYEAGRVQFRAQARAHSFAWTGGATARVNVVIHSNVPATPDLEVVEAWAGSASSQPGELDKMFDLSLENALGFKEATLAVYLNTTSTNPASRPARARVSSRSMTSGWWGRSSWRLSQRSFRRTQPPRTGTAK